MTYLQIMDINELIVRAVEKLVSVDPASLDADGYRHVDQLRGNVESLVDMMEDRFGADATL